MVFSQQTRASSQMTTNTRWPCYCTAHVYVVLHFYDSMWSSSVEAKLQAFDSMLKCVLPLDLQLSRGRLVVPLTGLTPPHICACSKPGHGFPTSYVMGFFLSSVSSIKMRGDCWFYWYWWHWWSSLFLFIIHRAQDTEQRQTNTTTATRWATQTKHLWVYPGAPEVPVSYDWHNIMSVRGYVETWKSCVPFYLISPKTTK